MFESRKELKSELKRYKHYYERVCEKSGLTAFEGISQFQMDKYQVERENRQLKQENEDLKNQLSKIINDKVLSYSLKETDEKGVYESVVKVRLITE